MSSGYYTARLALLEDREDEKRFWRIVRITLVIAALFGSIMQSIKLPEIEREKHEVIPPRLAKLIMEKKPPPPPPRVEVVKSKPKPKLKPKPKVVPKPEVKPVPEVKPEPKPVVIKRTPPKFKKPVTARETRAREKAENSGLFTDGNDLSDLMDTPSASKLLNQRVTKKNSSTRAAVPSVDSNILTANIDKGSGGIKNGKFNRNIGGANLKERQQSKLSGDAIQRAAKKKTSKRSAGRGKGEIDKVFDENKGAIGKMYSRALRYDPDIQGKIVLKITIAPSGKVTDVKIVSSELNNKSLEARLVSRIKMFKFGRKSVDAVTVVYPYIFDPP